MWQRKYGGSPDVLGRSITLDRQSYTVIGILPKGYELLQQTPDIVIAMGPWASKLPDDRSWHPGIFAIARLKPAVTLAQARAEMSTIAKRLLEKYPTDNIALDAVVNPMHEQLVSQARPALLTLLGAVIFVLLIACGNIANLMLTRATARRREISIRISLGASDWQIIRQLIIEGLLLSIMGAIAGVALAYAAAALAASASPERLCRPTPMCASTSTCCCFTAMLSICAGVFFGVAPAGHVRLSDLRAILNETERAGVGKQAKALRNILVVSEISLALLLLMGAGLFVRSLNRLSAVSLGFSDDHILVADLPVPPAGAAPADAHRNMDFYESTLRELHSLPGRAHCGRSLFPACQRTGRCDPLQHSGPPAAQRLRIHHGQLPHHQLRVFPGASHPSSARPLDRRLRPRRRAAQSWSSTRRWPRTYFRQRITRSARRCRSAPRPITMCPG